MTIPNLFWVGGTGNWSSASSWALTSGGASGAGTPDSTTTCTFDSNSGTGTSTVDSAFGPTQVNLNTPNITLSLAAAFSPGNLIQTQGVFTTNGQTVTMTGAWTCNGSLPRTINLGTSAIAVGTTLGLAGGAGFVIDFTGANLTLNAGTSTITLEAVSSTSVNSAWNSQPLAYNNVAILPGGSASSTVNGGDYDISIDGCTFNNFTITGTNYPFTQMAINAPSSGITINGTFTVTGFSRQNLVGIRSGANYSPTFITAAAVSLTNVNFFEIIAQGAAVPWTGTAVSDGQGNVGITGAASRSLFWVGNGGAWGDAGGAHWATSSGGSPGALCPLAQDDVHIDANSLSSTGQTIDASASRWLCRDLIMTGVSQAFTFITPGLSTGSFPSPTWATFGNITLNSNCTFTDPHTAEWSFRDQRNSTGASPSSFGTITCNGCTIVNQCRVSVNAITTLIQLGGAGLFSQKITGNGGMFSTVNGSNNYSLSVGQLVISAGQAAGFTFGTSAITVTGSGINVTAGTWNGLNTAAWTFTNNNPSLELAGQAWGAMTFSTPTGTIQIGNDQITNWNPVGSTIASLSITGGATQTANTQLYCPINVTGALNIVGNSAGVNRYLVQAGSAVGQTVPLSASSITALTNVDFMDIHAGGAAVPWTGTSLGDCQGNSGITFDTPVTTTWSGSVSANTSWTAATSNWSSGRIPLPQDDVTISGAWGSNLLFNLNLPRLCRNLTWSGTGGKVQMTNNSNGGLGTTIFGSLTLNSTLVGAARGASLASSGIIVLGDRRGGSTVTWGTVQPAGTSAIIISAPGGDYTAQDALTTVRPLQIQAGAFKLGSFSPSVGSLVLNGQQPRTLAIGAQTLTVSGTTTNIVDCGTGTTAAQFLTVTGSGIIDITDTTVAKTFRGAGQYFPCTIRYQANSAHGLTFTGSNTFATLTLVTSTARTDTLPANGCHAVGALTIQGAAAQLLSAVSSSPGTPTYLRLFAKAATESNTSISADVKTLSPGLPTGIL